MSRSRFIALLLALITLVVYLPVINHDFVNYDDDLYVVDNRIVQDGLTLAGVKWALTTSYICNWHPLTWLSHMMDCELFGLNAGAHHLSNVLFHSANVGLLFVLLLRLTGTVWPSLFVAALFAWHPTHVESVAWISERKDVLSMFFALLTLFGYHTFVKSNSRRYFWLALGSFALGLMAKPILVTLPFVLLLLDFWPLQRWPGRHAAFAGCLKLTLEKIPFFILSLASCLITIIVQRPAMSELENISLPFRLVNAVVAYGSYLLKLLWPAELSVIYPLAPLPPATFGLSAVMLILISAAAWLGRKRAPFFHFGWWWFLGTLVPVIGLVQVGSASMADRYTYMPAIGIFIACAFGLYEIAKHFHWPKFLLPATTIIFSIVCIVLTGMQLRHWRDSESLFRQALAVTKKNDIAHNNLGLALERQGRFSEALAEYREAAKIAPDRYRIHFHIGSMLEKLGHHQEALDEYRFCLGHNPTNFVYPYATGNMQAALGQEPEALQGFAEAIRLNTNFAMPYIGRAKVYFGQGKTTNGVAELWAAARTAPFDPETLIAVARPLAANENAAARDGESALTLATKANEICHGYNAEVLDVLGMAYAEKGDFTNAIDSVTSALALMKAAKRRDLQDCQQRLERYKNSQPWRESYGGTNAPTDR